ncbi:MAG TPA: hypothetical protein VL500_06100 [Candidatus Eisenbacteria bacterium]|nr:hypothetical protein [Candidatus Eisenbacteria bacterium]
MASRYLHPRVWLTRLALSMGAAVLALAGFASATRAANYVFSDLTPVTLTGSGITLQVLGGSRADSLDINATTLTVVVAAAESFSLRYPGPNPGTLNNTGGLSGCNNNGSDNDVTVNGPATVTFTPDSTTACAAPAGGGGGGGGGGTSAPSIFVVRPNGGETFNAGTAENVFWSTGGNGILSVRLSLSTDGGFTWADVIAANEANDGVFSWTVPDLATTRGRLKVEGLGSGGGLVATDLSDADFTIRAQPSTIVPAPTIDADMSIPLPPAPPLCAAGSRIKLPNDLDPATQIDSAVYYCGRDGKRYVFPNQETYFSWYPNFTGITVISAATMAQISIGGNITFKPGSLVKIQTDPDVYVVSLGGVLRLIPTEATAVALFGAHWADLVHDVPDVFFLNYVIGAPMQAP